MENHLAFFGAISHSQIDYLHEVLQEYSIGEYVICGETTTDSHKETSGQHFHFVVQMSLKDYHKFSKRIFIDKYNLRGVAKKGLPRQYGKVKVIENLSKMKAYTVKGGDKALIRSNLSETELDALILESFQNEEKNQQHQQHKNQLFSVLDTVDCRSWFQESSSMSITESFSGHCAGNYHRLEFALILFYIKIDKSPPANSIVKSLLIEWVRLCTKYSWEQRTLIIHRMKDMRNPFANL